MIIGLMGGSGSGKSAASALLREAGGYIIDADSIAHSNMEKGKPCYNEIVEFFGSSVLKPNGEIDRKILGPIVFSDKKNLAALNEISHKYVFMEIEREIKEALDEYKLIVIDAPLLIEGGLDRLCDTIWLVYADEEVRLRRIEQRDGISQDKALMRLKNQKSFEELRGCANALIENNGNMDLLKSRVLLLLKDLK